MAEKIGIYVCHCGSNIAGTVNVEEVARWAGQNIKGVVVAKDYKFMCSSLGQQMIEDDIREKGLTGVVVGACSPHLHEKTFRAACKRAGLNPYLFQMTNLREHVSWVTADKAGRHGEGEVVDFRLRRAREAPEAARADEGQGQPGHARGGRGHCRPPGRVGVGRRRLPRLPGRARALDRRPHGPIRQDLPHAGLLGLHPDAEDVGGRTAREHHPALLLGVGGGQRIGGQLQGENPPQGALRRRGEVQRLQRVHRGLPDPVPSQ